MSCPNWVIFTRKERFSYSAMSCTEESQLYVQVLLTVPIDLQQKSNNCCKIQDNIVSISVFIYMGHHVLSFAKFIISKLMKPHICCTLLLSPCRSTWRCTWKYSFITVRMFICDATSGTSVLLVYLSIQPVYPLKWSNCSSSSSSYKSHCLVKTVLRLWVKYQFNNSHNQSL